MAVVVYKCDTCKRELEKIRDIAGMEVVSRCTISLGCRGKLYQERILNDYKRGSLPSRVSGLTDWQQRRVLYNHEQPIQNTEWIITHNLGTVPSISVYVDRPIEGDDENREEIIPQDVRIINADIMVLTFDREWSGIAQLVARQSDPDLLTPRLRLVTEETTQVQLSATGEMTIATRLKEGAEPAALNIHVNYTTTAGIDSVITYVADDQPSIASPWRNVDTIVVRGKVFTVRSYQSITAEMTTGFISSGSTFRFTEVDPTNTETYRDIERGEILILLAASPYELADKITNQIIDVTNVTEETNQFAFYYDTGEMIALDTVVKTIFPPIHTV